MPENRSGSQLEFRFTSGALEQETILALLSILPFYAFEERESQLAGYLRLEEWTQECRKELDQLCVRFDIQYTFETLPDENWNARWEADFQPVVVGDFCCIRASFHEDIDKVKHEVIVDPKMAFGTGHHATTWMVIHRMQYLNFGGKKILDFGCGTGVLAILARKLGAEDVVAIDIDPNAVENTAENCDLNGVDRIQIFEGDQKLISGGKFDIILANLNRNAILNALPELRGALIINGVMLLSGILEADVSVIQPAIKANGLQFLESEKRDGWVCMQVTC